MGVSGQEGSNEGGGPVFIDWGFGWWWGPPGTDRKRFYGRIRVYDHKLVLTMNSVFLSEVSSF